MNRFVTRDEQKNKILGSYNKTDRLLLEGIGQIHDVKLILEQDTCEEAVVLYHPYLCPQKESLSFLQILLDERYADGYLSISAEILKEVGYLNERIPGKRLYELLLRVAQKYTIVGMPLTIQYDTEQEKKADIDKDYVTDCYVAGKYSNILQEQGWFNEVIETLIQQCRQDEQSEEKILFLEDMLSRGSRFQWLEAGTAPVMLYYGVTYCYNVMNVMQEQLAAALEHYGVPVIRYDEQQEGIAGLSRYVGRTFRAIIGIQSYLFSVYMTETQRFLHDQIKGPKFNLVLDHPFWLKQQLLHVPGNYYVLTHDRNYKKFIEKYYPDVCGCYLFPPGGILQQEEISFTERSYDVSFIGTYGDYREKCRQIHEAERETRFLANRMLIYMRRYPHLTAEAALQKALSYYNINLSDEQFLEMMYRMGTAVQCIMYYYREKVIRQLGEAGITVHIWGSSWKKSNLMQYTSIHFHDDVQWQESLEILRQSKISLNIMAWHKAGFTERMANSMLAGALLLTDETDYEPQNLRNGRECVMFSLSRLYELPTIVKKLLEDETKRNSIARKGYAYAKKKHTWETRAEEFLAIVNQR